MHQAIVSARNDGAELDPQLACAPFSAVGPYNLAEGPGSGSGLAYVDEGLPCGVDDKVDVGLGVDDPLRVALHGGGDGLIDTYIEGVVYPPNTLSRLSS
jgi:hypothetical protein